MSIAIIGECMLELTHQATGTSRRPMIMNYGGDTMNTAIYLARSNLAVSYATALSDDEMSQWMTKQWRQQGVDCSLVMTIPGSAPGMYMVNVDENGERSFMYWRKDSPASRFFNDPDRVRNLSQLLRSFELLYLSGISLAILPKESRQRLIQMIDDYRENGGTVIFEDNYRPALWDSMDETRESYSEMFRRTDIAMLTYDHQKLLFGHESDDEIHTEMRSYGVSVVVVKKGIEGCVAFEDGNSVSVPTTPIKPVDTTGAGDAFNAAFIAARFGQGANLADACRAGHNLALQVIQFKGAIIPMPDPTIEIGISEPFFPEGITAS